MSMASDMSLSKSNNPSLAMRKGIFRVSAALREWAGICAALQAGRGTVIIRKGGLVEARHGFQAKYEPFLLQPTHWHEIESEGLDPNMFKMPRASGATRASTVLESPVLESPVLGSPALESTLSERSIERSIERSSDPGVCMSVAEVVGERVIESSREEELDELLSADVGLPLATYTKRQIDKRRSFRATLPMHVLVLRVRNLLRPYDLGPAGVGGCKSWIELNAEQTLEAGDAAVDDTLLERVIQHVKAERIEVGGPLP